MPPFHSARLEKPTYVRLGVAPLPYVEALRHEHARALLESGAASLDAVAQSAGFASDEVLRGAFHRHIGSRPPTTASASDRPPIRNERIVPGAALSPWRHAGYQPSVRLSPPPDATSDTKETLSRQHAKGG